MITGQTKISGFVFETGNRGYINQAVVTLSNEKETEYYGQLTTDVTGAYEFTVSGPGTYLLSVEKKPYFDHKEVIAIEASHGKSVYLKHALKRNPGYIFEITIAEKDLIPDAPTDALKGALIEVYNNTKKEEVMVIENLQSPEFKVDLLKGNHYTLLIRKEGFLSKRMEAFVDVEGCILCFEGIGNVSPGVSDNLTEANSMGVLLANVEMDRYFAGKVIGLNDIYYDFGESKITKEAATELRKVAEFLKDNPGLKVELGSHTDSRGGGDVNMSLSEKRARSAVEFLVNKGGIVKEKISAKGYGETILTNKCGDGVECTDEEHRLNRRTELKILDVVNEGMQRRLRQMKAEELIDEILADIDNAGQIRVKEGQTIEQAIAEKGEMNSTFISDPSQIQSGTTEQTTTMVSNVEIVTPEETVKVETPAPAVTIIETIKKPEEAAAAVEEDELDELENILEGTVSEIGNSEKTADKEIAELMEMMDEDGFVVNEVAIEPQAPAAVDISEKVDMSKGEGNIVAETPKTASLPEATPIRKAETKETIAVTSPAPKVTQEVPKESSNTAVEEWIRPGASDYIKPSSVAETARKRYSPEYSGYKVVVIFSRYELPKEHNIFSKYDDVDIYTTADGNKLYMLGAHLSKKEAYAHMNIKLKKLYPHSYVVGFENGIRIY